VPSRWRWTTSPPLPDWRIGLSDNVFNVSAAGHLLDQVRGEDAAR